MTTALRVCPACRSVAIDWSESTDAVATFIQNADGIDPEGIQGYGDIMGVRGRCRSCGHRWRPRGVSQIIHLPGHPDYHPRKEAARLAAKE